MRSSKSTIHLLSFAVLVLLVLILLVTSNLLYLWSGPKRPPVGQSEKLRTQIIASEIKSFIEDQGVPNDINSLPEELFGHNTRSEVYLNRDAFKVDSSGHICDSSGIPYAIAIRNGVVSVTSTQYSITSTTTYSGGLPSAPK
jgi:hypothetical protein